MQAQYGLGTLSFFHYPSLAGRVTSSDEIICKLTPKIDLGYLGKDACTASKNDFDPLWFSRHKPPADKDLRPIVEYGGHGENDYR